MTEMDSKLKEFATNHAKEVESLLAYSLKEQTEFKDNKFIWKTEIEAHIQSIKEHLNDIENKVLLAFQEFEREVGLDGTEKSMKISEVDWSVFKDEIRRIFEKRGLS